MAVELGTAATQDSSAFATAAQGLEADAAVKSVVAGSNVIVDNTDPQNPIVSASALTGYIGNPSVAPVLSSVSGGTLAAATYYVKITYENSTGETLPSPESNLAVALDNLLVVDSPSSATNATGYNVYVSTTTGTETKQNSTPISIGTNWTEPTSGLISGSALPSSNTTGTVGGTVSSVSVAAANGFLASVATPTTTPDITIKTGVTGILYGNGTGVSAAVAGNFPTLNQNTTGNAATATATASLGAVATIAALRLYSGTAFGQTVFMQGYTTQNDGGQGPFQWGAYATDNGGTIITPTGQVAGSWYRIFDGLIDVSFFGSPNGTNDNTSFTTALLLGAIRVVKRSAAYILTAPLKLSGPASIKFEGGPTLNFILTGTENAFIIDSTNANTAAGSALDGTAYINMNNTGGTVFSVQASTDTVFGPSSGMLIVTNGNGNGIDFGPGALNYSTDNCVIKNLDLGSIPGDLIQVITNNYTGTQDVAPYILNSRFVNIRGDIVGGRLIHINANAVGPNVNVNGLLFKNISCNLSSTSLSPIYISSSFTSSNSIDFSIDGGYFALPSSNSAPYVDCDSATTASSILGIHIENFSTFGGVVNQLVFSSTITANKPAQSDLVFNGFGRVVETHGNYTSPYPTNYPNGATIWASDLGIPIYSQSGAWYNSLGMFLAPNATTKPIVAGTVYQNVNGNTLTLYIPITYNPTSIALASCSISLGSGSAPPGIFADSRPATAISGEVDTITLRIPPMFYYQVSLVNATVASTVNGFFGN